jgi:hypothetical protein
MTFLPIVERELRVAARRAGTYWGRAAAALAAMAIMAFIFLAVPRTAPRELAQGLFITLSVISLGVALLSGIRYTADCLSEEKREGTLGLLFLTDLRGYDIVLGKLAATSLNACYGLLAIFPVLAIPLLMGGVSISQFSRMVLLLADSLLFSLAAGIWASALSLSARKAMSVGFLLILLVHAGLPALGACLAAHSQAASVDEVFLIPSAGFACFLVINDLVLRARPGPFYWSLGVIHGLTWLLLLWASVRVRYSWQDRVAGAARLGWRQRWRQWLRGNPQTVWRNRARLLDRSPCLWLASRDPLKRILVWVCLAALAGLWLAGYAKWPDDWMDEGLCIATAITIHVLLKLYVASEACQQFGPDRRSGALELLLSTPLTVREMLQGHVLALRRQFLWPVLAVILVDLLFLLHLFGKASEPGWWFWFGAVGISTFLLDLQALAWVGLWTGLTAKHPNRASGTTVITVLVLFWILYWGTFILAEALGLPLPRLSNEYFALAYYFLLAVALDLTLWFWARSRLQRKLRAVATQRFAPPQTFLARLFSRRQAGLLKPAAS